jgi:hypothetical protein
LLLAAAKVRAIRTVSAAAMTSTPAMHAETILATVLATVLATILATIALVVTILVLAGILLRLVLLRLATAGDECRQAADLLSTFLATLIRLLLMRLRLMLRAVVHLLIARRERLGIARQIRLLLRFTRSVARLVLAHEGLGVVIIAVKSLVGVLLAGGALLLLRLLVVVWILLTELFLRGGDQAKIVLGMLVVVLGGNRIAGTLRVARKLDIFFRYMRSGSANFDVGTV